MAEPIVIVDSDGTEHEFPAGFDPKRAAMIVRSKTTSYTPDPTIQAQTADALNQRQGGFPALSHAPRSDAPDEGPTGLTRIGAMLEPMAYPHSMGDMAAMLIPSGGGAAVDRLVSPIVKGAAKYGGAALEAGASLLPVKGRAALSVLRELNPSSWNSPLTVAGREGRAVAASKTFNELPLAQQMQQFPEVPAPVTTRQGMPILSPPTPSPDAAIEAELRARGIDPKRVVSVTPGTTRGAVPIRQIKPVASHAPATAPALEPVEPPPNVTSAPVSQPLGQPRVMTLKDTPTTWTPESARARLEMDDWHSGADPGTPEAQRASYQHREDAANKAHWKYLMESRNTALLPGAILGNELRKALLEQLRGGDETTPPAR